MSVPVCAEQLPLLAASSLLSTRWTEDNLVTPDPVHRYNGAIVHQITVPLLQELLSAISQGAEPFEVVSGSLGVLTWNIRCRGRKGEFMLVLPVALDRPPPSGLTRVEVPERAFKNALHFQERGLTRYLLPRGGLLRFADHVHGATFSLPPAAYPVTFRLGSARLDVLREGNATVTRLGPQATSELTVELIAALAYHYDGTQNGGTTVADVLINEGDFLVSRNEAGGFAVHLALARRLETGVDRHRFLLYLIQLLAFEDWPTTENIAGLAAPISGPALAFAGLSRGLELRYLDLGRSEAEGQNVARSWIADFGRTREGRAYRPWIASFLAGTLNYRSPEDPRKPWSNLLGFEARAEVERLKKGPEATAAFSELVSRLSQAMCVGPKASPDALLEANDLDRGELNQLLKRLELPETTWPELAANWFMAWPFQSEADLAHRVPGLSQALNRHRPELLFHQSEAESDSALSEFDSLPPARPNRVLANPEIFGTLRVPETLSELAVRAFPSFQDYVDDMLHDPRFGYYARRVVIGTEGHFNTHPELLSPHYGRWIAKWAFEVWSSLVASGELEAGERFSLIEFGAGNGRLARDVLDQARALQATDERWEKFTAILDYRIYEISESLRKKQRALLGADVTVLEGDARNPAAALRHDFPEGVRGLIVSNELPDAFGVHKVLLSGNGNAEAVLVVPRLEVKLLKKLPDALAQACRATDATLGAQFSWEPRPGELLLDRDLLGQVLSYAYAQKEKESLAIVDALSFEEVLVRPSYCADLLRAFGAGATEYAHALRAEASGVVQYVNLHADGYIRQLASVLSLGQILTIDYGDTTLGLFADARKGKFLFRCFCDEGPYQVRPNDPYTRPAGQDLTSDVNFTDLALAGLSAGLSVAYYGPERTLCGAELGDVLDKSSERTFARIAGNTAFKLLVLGKGVSYCPDGPGLEAAPLFAVQP